MSALSKLIRLLLYCSSERREHVNKTKGDKEEAKKTFLLQSIFFYRQGEKKHKMRFFSRSARWGKN